MSAPEAGFGAALHHGGREVVGIGGGSLWSQHTPSLTLLLPRGPGRLRPCFLCG